MNVLVLAHNDSDNIMISNILFEMQMRGYKIRIFSVFMDNRTNRMFKSLKCEINRVDKLSDADIEWCDCVLSALRAHINIGGLGDKIFIKKYIFVYNHYIDKTWYTPGADFMFTCGYTRKMDHIEDCASMAVGCPKDDSQQQVINSAISEKQFLFIDSGHYPFSHKGKRQVASLLLKICHKFPEYKLVVKPRFLPNESNMLHANLDHLYSVLIQLSNENLPVNLVLLNEHRDMQELIDQSDCVLMLCSSAYVDVALRNKPMIIIDGIDNDDKYELRNDIEYKNIYDLRKKSGCVVNCHEVLQYLPYGIKCSEAHLKKLVAYPKYASKRIVDVIDFVVTDFLRKGLFPRIQEYNYEDYKEKMAEDQQLNWDIILSKRIKNFGNDTLNRFNRVIACIDKSEYINAIDNEYSNYPTDVNGINDFKAYLSSLYRKIVIANGNILVNDELDQAELLRAMYESKDYVDLFAIDERYIKAKAAWHYYIGMIYLSENSREKGIDHLIDFILEGRKRYYAKYFVEEDGIRNAFVKIIRFYDGDNIADRVFANLYIVFYVKGIDKRLKEAEVRKINTYIPSVIQRLGDNGDYKLAFECAEIYIKNTKSIFEINKVKKRENSLLKENKRITASRSYKIGRFVTFVPRKSAEILKSLRMRRRHNASRESALFKIARIYRDNIGAYRKYRDLCNSFGINVEFGLEALGTGNVYISGQYMNDYTAKNGKREILLLPEKNCYDVALLFNYYNAELVLCSHDDYYDLLRLLRFLGTDTLNIIYLNYHNVSTQYYGILTWIEGVNGIDMGVLYDNVVFNGAHKDYELKHSSVYGKHVFGQEIQKGKTVVLSPYAGTIKKISDYFWEFLAKRLIEKGYLVYTNIGGDDEKEISGTYPIRIPYDEWIDFIESAGCLIGLRSGLLDVSETARCKKVALYTDTVFKRGISDDKGISSFSLNKLFGRNDWLELEVQPSNGCDIVKMIIDFLEEDSIENNNYIYANQIK